MIGTHFKVTQNYKHESHTIKSITFLHNHLHSHRLVFYKQNNNQTYTWKTFYEFYISKFLIKKKTFEVMMSFSFKYGKLSNLIHISI